MKIEIEVPAPKPGQKVYVYTTPPYVGGLGTVSMVIGDSVFIKEAPEISFNWPTLVKNQVSYVELHGGSKVLPRPLLKRVG